MAEIASRLREDAECLRKMVVQAGFAGAETGVRVKEPDLLLSALDEAADALDAKDKRIAELEAALDGALDTILEHTLADSRPVTEEDQPAIDAFDRAIEDARARIASRLPNKEDRNG